MRNPFLILGLLLVVAMAGVRAYDPFPTRAFRAFYFDLLQRVSPRPYVDAPVRIVDIDDASLAAIGQWPWPRTKLAELVEKLNAYGAAVIGFDVMFSEADRYSPARLLEDPAVAGLLEGPRDTAALRRLDYDQLFADAMRAGNVVLGVAATLADSAHEPYDKAGFVEIGEHPSAGLPTVGKLTPLVPSLREAAARIGEINVSPGSESNVVRTVPLVWRAESGLVPSLSLEVLRVALGQTTMIVSGSPDLRGVTEAVQVGDYAIPTTADGQIWVRYRHDDPRLYVSAKDVLADAQTPELRAALEGNIVLVGTSAAGLLDIRAVPLGENIPGVSIHAQIIEQVLLDQFLYRSDFVRGLELLAFIAIGIVVSVVMSRFGAATSISAGAAAAVTILAGGFYLFLKHGILFDVTFPLVGGAVNFGCLAAFQFIVVDREKRVIQRSFAHYVSPTVLKELEARGYHLELGGEIRPVTVMFSDIRNFTHLSETMSPSDLVTLLNALFSTLADAILEEQGTIDKFIGDAIMAFWNAPVELADHEARACLAVLGMRTALARFNETLERDGKPPIRIGMGCASGIACVGNIGSAQRFNYSVIGDTVNVASRIESSCKAVGYDIVLLRSTALAASELATLPAGFVELKGKTDRLAIDILVGDAAVARSEAFASLRAAHEKLIEALAGRNMRAAKGRLVKDCLSHAAAVDPALVTFYARIVERAEDFEKMPAA
ncbi:MAG: CHASE2 domain-containing protein [Flavobacteriaceae bacterium]